MARWAACEAQGENRSAVKKLMKDSLNAEGVVVGDETRLRQIITNLARSVSMLLFQSQLDLQRFDNQQCL
jgi:hypothetical protein